ncbi:hypothetical protein HKCCSP123_19865 [Rhodobacterales bacterium HKCCSP123]|nr:hypothetical protein [Rhodobacterales bacterium HKCCSP123]
MRRAGLALCLVLGAGGTAAEEALPPYSDCLSRAVAHFEMEFSRTGLADAREDFEIVSRERVEYCGTLAIVVCDRSEAPLACQADLAARQWALRDRVLAGLPAPEAVTGDAVWAGGLYPVLWGVAHGSSAGPDCAGADAAYAAWCEMREASGKLAEAVSLWQVARLLGVAGPAVEAGWVGAAHYAPLPRPERGDTR